MKKICLTIIFSLLCTVVGFAHSMPPSELVVGGISLGSTLGYVKSIYGEPQATNATANPFAGFHVYRAEYVYGPLLTISGRVMGNDAPDESTYKVYELSLPNDLTTPSGIAVGMPYSKVAGLYGQGTYYHNETTGMDGYVYAMPNSLKEMILYVDKNKNITEIYLGEDI